MSRATFFIIGENAQANPDLVRREIDEGHEVGNHTFTHPNLGESPSGLVELELNATQRLFEALTGRSMRLFRPPYFGDAEPTTPTKSCRSRSRRASATSPSGCASIPATGSNRRRSTSSREH